MQCIYYRLCSLGDLCSDSNVLLTNLDEHQPQSCKTSIFTSKTRQTFFRYHLQTGRKVFKLCW